MTTIDSKRFDAKERMKTLVRAYPSLARVVAHETSDRWVRNRMVALAPETLAGILKESADQGDLEKMADLEMTMLERDPHLQAVMATRVSAVAATPFEIKSLGASDHEQRYADLIRRAHTNMPNFRRTIKDLLMAIGTGLSVCEVEWERKGGLWLPSNMTHVLKRRLRVAPDGSVRLWDGGRVQGGDFTDLYRRSHGRPLSDWPNQFVVHTPRTTGRSDYPNRSGLLRTAAWYYVYKTWMIKFWVHGAEKFSNPWVIGRLPEDAPDDLKNELLSRLQQFTGEQVGVFEEGSGVEFVQHNYKQSSDMYLDALEWFDTAMSKCILGSEANTELGSTGSRAAAESQGERTLDPRFEEDFRELFLTLRSQLWKPLGEFNAHIFDGVVPPCPVADFIEGKGQANVSLIQPLLQIEGGGMTVNELREISGLPTAPEYDRPARMPVSSVPAGAPLGALAQSAEPVSEVTADLPLVRTTLQTTSPLRMTPLGKVLTGG